MSLFDGKKSVLVVGAGASLNYGYPPMESLSRMIYDILAPGQRIRNFAIGGGSDALMEPFRDELLASRLNIDAFILKQIATYPNEKDSEIRFQYLTIVMRALAGVFMGLEIPEKLMYDKGEYHWLKELFESLNNELNGEWDKFPKDKFNIVNFNYDRTIEYYFYRRLLDMNFEIPLIRGVISRMNISHVHGYLGELSFGGSSGRDYSTEFHFLQLSVAASTLNLSFYIIGKNAKPERRMRFQEIIKNAKKISFLGFSYHPDNMWILGLGPDRADREVIGSSYGMSTN